MQLHIGIIYDFITVSRLALNYDMLSDRINKKNYKDSANLE